MNTSKTSTSIFSLSAALLMVAALASPALATNEAQTAVDAKAAVTKTTETVEAKALRKKAKLPRKWVWKKYAKRFDSMYRK